MIFLGTNTYTAPLTSIYVLQ